MLQGLAQPQASFAPMRVESLGESASFQFTKETPMPRYKTRDGWVEVDNWGYQLQGRNGAALSVKALAH
jgi:hypothetical protein